MPRQSQAISVALSILLLCVVFGDRRACGAEIGRGQVYEVVEISFAGPPQKATDAPARDIEFWARLVHESGQPEYKVHGFWDGDGRGGASGNVFKLRFCPTQPGRWRLLEVHSNREELKGHKQGDYIAATPGMHPGFWTADPQSAGSRWYRRSDGSHPYIFGNTHYTFLTGYGPDGKPTGNDIADDIAANTRYFKKLRFALCGDRYPHPEVKPFLDEEGRPSDDGDNSHRPHPRWFDQRVDVAVQAAYKHDLIADLILCGPDTRESRSTLRAGNNKGDAMPFLNYIAARYGNYPNVWMCLCNEYDIKEPKYAEAYIAQCGQTLRKALPHPTPLSVHASQRPPWSARFDELPPWNDHQIVQQKLRNIAASADVLHAVWQNVEGSQPRRKPTINDELSYQGDGDKHSEQDTIESHLGAFLGGAYASTGEKYGNKLGQYFVGNFDAEKHSAADNLQFLREVIDKQVTFWRMSPATNIFSNLDSGFRGMAWEGQEYVLGTNRAKQGLVAELPSGTWGVMLYDCIARQSETLANDAKGRFTFDAPDSRAILFHFRKR